MVQTLLSIFDGTDFFIGTIQKIFRTIWKAQNICVGPENGPHTQGGVQLLYP